MLSNKTFSTNQPSFKVIRQVNLVTLQSGSQVVLFHVTMFYLTMPLKKINGIYSNQDFMKLDTKIDFGTYHENNYKKVVFKRFLI